MCAAPKKQYSTTPTTSRPTARYGAKSIEDGYSGNPLLKPCGVYQTWNKEQVEEYLKCREDPQYFISKYLKTVHIDKGLVPLNLYPYQKRLIEHINKNRFTVTLAPRQCGKSTTVSSWLIHYVLFNSNKTVAILANRGETAREILGRVQTSYQYIPKWLQQGVKEWNKGSMVLENESRIIAGSTSSDSIRGYSISALLVDETAFIRNWNEFYDSVYPTISSGVDSRLILISTPKGFNHFNTIWKSAVTGTTDFKPMRIHWDEMPSRDEKFKVDTIRNIGKLRWAQEFECEFLGSAETLISGRKLGELTPESPLHHIQMQEGDDNSGMKVFDEPVEGRRYTITADTAKGKGDNYDFSCAIVIDVSELPYKVVAVYRNNAISPLAFPTILKAIATKYNEASVLVENNISEVAQSLHEELGYHNTLATITSKKRQVLSTGYGRQAMAETYGVHMSSSVKSIGCMTLKTLMEEGKLVIRDQDIINELYSFVKRKETYKAEEGSKDDLTMCLVMFAWLTTQDGFRDISGSYDTSIAREIFDRKLEELEDNLLPFGVSSNSIGVEPKRDTFVDASGALWVEDNGCAVNGSHPIRSTRIPFFEGDENPIPQPKIIW